MLLKIFVVVLPKEGLAGRVPPTLLLLWHQLYNIESVNNTAYIQFYSQYSANPSFGMTTTKILRCDLAWCSSISVKNLLHVQRCIYLVYFYSKSIFIETFIYYTLIMCMLFWTLVPVCSLFQWMYKTRHIFSMFPSFNFTKPCWTELLHQMFFKKPVFH